MHDAIIDPTQPWKLPRLKFEFRKYPFTMTAAEWGSLLDRAKRGDAEAAWEVAERFSDGCKDESGRILVGRSTRKAAEWFRRAAERGFVQAQITFGVLLGDGQGTQRNPQEALVWLKRAFRAKDGYASGAANNIAITYRENGELRRAVYWFKKCLASGDDGASVQLGVHYYWGRGARTNHAAAVRYLRRATTAKNITPAERDDAFFYLGIAYLDGKGVRASHRTARKLLQRANIDNDHPAASRILSRMSQTRPTD